MPIYQVSYDLTRADREEYEALSQALKNMDSFHAQESVWFVSFEGTDQDLEALLEPIVGLRDKLTVTLVTEITTAHGIGLFIWLRDHGLNPKTHG